MRKYSLILLLLCLASLFARATSPDGIWYAETTDFGQQNPQFEAQLQTQLQLNIEALEQVLETAKSSGMAVLWLPSPDGNFYEVILTPNSVMHPKLADKFPNISTYTAVGVTEEITGRLDFSPRGFHALLQSRADSWYISPERKGRSKTTYNSFYSALTNRQHSCEVDIQNKNGSASSSNSTGFVQNSLRSSGTNLRTYRLAVTATSNYSLAIDGPTPAKANVLSAIVSAVNRINQLYSQDLAIELQLIGNNEDLIFTTAGPSDPFNGMSPGVEMLIENQTQVDAIIGNDNYDIGHVFDSNNSSGIATLGAACWDGFKARGVSGETIANLGSDTFYIDIAAHEIGHQFNARHSFNGTSSACSGNRSSSTAYEPGSGSTIMSYAGICSSENLQNHSDFHFHAGSINEILDFLADPLEGGSCGDSASTSNTPPVISQGSNESIPALTPFILTASAIDADLEDDVITFSWDQTDIGGSTNSAATIAVDDGNRPLFRTWTPTTTATRYFPSLSDVVNGTSTLGEALPASNRTLTFAVVARSGSYGLDMENIILTVIDGGTPFAVLNPTAGANYIAGGNATIVWDKAGTDKSPINCANVDILYSDDSGSSFDTILLASTANDGQQTLTLPGTNSETGRIMVMCSDNIFYNVSGGDFSIGDNTQTIISISADSLELNESDTELTPFSFTITRSGNTAATSTVDYAVSGTGANPAESNDFENNTLATGTVTFNATETSKPLTINASGDTTFEEDETFIVSLENPVDASIGDSTAMSTIINNDPEPLIPTSVETAIEECTDNCPDTTLETTVTSTTTTQDPPPEVTEEEPAPFLYYDGGGDGGSLRITDLLVLTMLLLFMSMGRVSYARQK